MAYEGETLLSCPASAFLSAHAWVVVVSGTGPNLCGHALLHSGEYSFHVAGFNKPPKYMNQEQFKRYCAENGKRVLRRDFVFLSDPAAAQRKMNELLSKSWIWFGLPHNCATFVEEILHAGGAKRAGIYLNCPSAERF